MDSLKIKALLRSIECGSLTKAAEELGYTQAGLTHMMDRLENEIGFALLQRDKNGVRLTYDGELLLPALKDFLSGAQQLEHAIDEILTHSRTTIRIGTYTSILKQWLPLIINSFRKENPDVLFEIRDSSLDNIYSWVSTSELDVGFASRQEMAGTAFIPLRHDPFFAVLPRDYPVPAGQERCPIEAFSGSHFLMPTYGFDRDVLRTLHKNGIKPVMTSTSVDDAAVTSMVEMGLGVSILPELVLKGIDCKNLIVKPLSPYSYRELGMVIPQEKIVSPLVKRFVRFSEQILKEKAHTDF